jgi:glycosyltransferase involved in cell wall biosynthesis
MKLKVLFLSAWYPSEKVPLSGIFIKEHAKAASLHHEIGVMFIQPMSGEKAAKRYEMVEVMEDGLKTIRIRVYCHIGNRQIERVIRLAGCLWSFQRLLKNGWRPDLIHGHEYGVGLPALLIGRRYGIPVLISEHWSWFIQKRLTFGRRFVAKWVLNNADGVIAVSNHLREAMRSYGVKKPISIVPNVVDTSIFFPVNNENSGQGRTKKILFVGRMSPEKGVRFLLEAIAIVWRNRQDFVLDIAGDGEQKEELCAMAKMLGIEPAVHFLGFQKKANVARAMQSCDFLVQPSLWETFGIAPIEALACGRPVVVSDIPGPRELIGPDMGLFVPPGDALSLAEAISVMLDNHEQYSRKILADYVADHFGYAVVGRLLDTTYRNLCDKRQA